MRIQTGQITLRVTFVARACRDLPPEHGLRRRLRNLSDLQVRVDGEIGIADGRIRWRRRMPRPRLEFHTGAHDRVRVSVAPGAWHREGIRGNKLIQGTRSEEHTSE